MELYAGSADTTVHIWQPGLSGHSAEESEHAGYGVVHVAHLEVAENSVIPASIRKYSQISWGKHHHQLKASEESGPCFAVGTSRGGVHSQISPRLLCPAAADC